MRDERSKESRLRHLRRRLARRERDLRDIVKRAGYRAGWQTSGDTALARSKIRQAHFKIRELIDTGASGSNGDDSYSTVTSESEGVDPASRATNQTPTTGDSGDDQASVASSGGPTPPADPPPQRPPPPNMESIEAGLYGIGRH